jgi:hypothetical protein
VADLAGDARSRDTGNHFVCGLDQKKEENGANLTRGSLTTMGERSSRASATSGRDRGLTWRGRGSSLGFLLLGVASQHGCAVQCARIPGETKD